MSIVKETNENENPTLVFDATKFNVTDESNDDEVKLNIPSLYFDPKEWNVEVSSRNVLMVTAQHEGKVGEKNIERNFELKKYLPADVDSKTVAARFTSNGILVITAPRNRKT